jgi:hypothetical protein
MLALRQYARALVFVSLALLPGQVRAATFEKLIMPGPVSQAHAKIEENCSGCHDRANRERQTSLCLDCHKDIAEDVRSKTRYHGRMPASGTGECQGCHSEHHGRDADITRLSQAGFTHDLANFALLDSHVSPAIERTTRTTARWGRSAAPVMTRSPGNRRTSITTKPRFH